MKPIVRSTLDRQLNSTESESVTRVILSFKHIFEALNEVPINYNKVSNTLQYARRCALRNPNSKFPNDLAANPKLKQFICEIISNKENDGSVLQFQAIKFMNVTYGIDPRSLDGNISENLIPALKEAFKNAEKEMTAAYAIIAAGHIATRCYEANIQFHELFPQEEIIQKIQKMQSPLIEKAMGSYLRALTINNTNEEELIYLARILTNSLKTCLTEKTIVKKGAVDLLRALKQMGNASFFVDLILTEEIYSSINSANSGNSPVCVRSEIIDVIYVFIEHLPEEISVLGPFQLEPIVAAVSNDSLSEGLKYKMLGLLEKIASRPDGALAVASNIDLPNLSESFKDRNIELQCQLARVITTVVLSTEDNTVLDAIICDSVNDLLLCFIESEDDAEMALAFYSRMISYSQKVGNSFLKESLSDHIDSIKEYVFGEDDGASEKAREVLELMEIDPDN